MLDKPQIGLLTESTGYKPFRYPWSYELWKKQQQVHWMVEEVSLGDDIKEWQTVLTASERNLLTQIFRLFTKSDIEVADNYMERLARIFKPTEIKMMLAANANMETVHIDAYSMLLETIGMPEAEYEAFADIAEMKAKTDHWDTFSVDTPEDTLHTLAMFGAFAEGLQLFAMFAMLMNFPRFNKMKGMGQIVSWSVRDESLHCEGIIKLYHAYARETGALTPEVKARITSTCRKVVEMEDAFIDRAMEMGEVEGMTALDIKNYVRFIADWRLRQLGLPAIYGVTEHPLPWLQPLLSGVEHANFFETRPTEYSKASATGDWNAVFAHAFPTV